MNYCTLMSDRISNGISTTRIFAMFWIVSVNYLSWLFKFFYTNDYAYATANSVNFLEVLNKNQFLWDKIAYYFSYSGWTGVVVFVVISGVSLWLSTLSKGTYKFSDYVESRFNSVYVPYLFMIPFAVIYATFLFGTHTFSNMGISAFIAGAAKYNEAAHILNTPMWFFSLIILMYLLYSVIPLVYSKFKTYGVIGLFVFLFAVWFIWSKDLSCLYPLLPFGIVFIGGILFMHFVIKFKINKLLIPLIPICAAIVVYMVVFETQDTNVPTLLNPYLAGFIAMVGLFSIGYWFPVKWAKILRFMARGTFAVFLFHYLAIHIIVKFVMPFIPSLAIAISFIYIGLMVCGCSYQWFFDKYVGNSVRNIFAKKYEIGV